MNLINSSRSDLLSYVSNQLTNFFPDNKQYDVLIDKYLDGALLRLEVCISAVKMWKKGEFDYLHSSQYATFLYYLSNEIWRNTNEKELPTKLFLLNKALNGIDVFYEVEMPEIFFIGHSVGIVIAKATYNNYLVLYQNSTIGKNHGVAPVVAEGTIVYPNASIIGDCNVSRFTTISQGVSLIDRSTPQNSLVFQSAEGLNLFKTAKRKYIEDYFHSIDL